MTFSKPKLSKAGNMVFDTVLKDAREELAKYTHIRTKFYFPVNHNKCCESMQLRDFIDLIISEFEMKFPFDDRESDYANFVNSKCFSLLSMQLQRLHPDCYLIITQKMEGEIIFIVHDKKTSPLANFRITWQDNSLRKGIIESVSLYLTKEELE